jgi:hypothetical protein
MKKKITIIIGSALIAIILIAAAVYTVAFKPKTYSYKTVKGQGYSLNYFENAELVDTKDISEKLSNADLTPGTPVLVSYIADDLGIAMLISDPLDKPFTKSCTNTDRLAFTVDDYEVCAIKYKDKTISLLAKVGNKSKYFVATLFVVYDGTRILEQKDKAYARQFNNFNILNYEKDIKKYLRSIQPVN